jgi:hypothetical protein
MALCSNGWQMTTTAKGITMAQPTSDQIMSTDATSTHFVYDINRGDGHPVRDIAVTVAEPINLWQAIIQARNYDQASTNVRLVSSHDIAISKSIKLDLRVEITRTPDNWWTGRVFLPEGALLDETETQGLGYNKVCEEIGVILRAEVARQLELDSAASVKSPSDERAEIIAQAEAIDAETMATDVSGPGKFECIPKVDRRFALALNTIALNGLADDQTRDGTSVIGKHVVGEDSQGFVWISGY